MTPETNSGEVPLMWLGGEPDDREEYAAEIELGTAGWQTSTPPPPAGAHRDELTRIAHDQGWDANEVEAIRSLLEPASLGEAGVETAESQPAEPEPEPEPDDVPVIGAIDSPDEPEPEIEKDVEPETPPPSAGWPAEDPTISFPLPGGDELRKALDALGLPASERERQDAMAAQRAHWAKTPPPQGDATRALLRPSARGESSRAEPDAPRGNPEATADEHAPEGEPEWLRGRRDPAARAYRRLRRIFPS